MPEEVVNPRIRRRKRPVLSCPFDDGSHFRPKRSKPPSPMFPSHPAFRRARGGSPYLKGNEDETRRGVFIWRFLLFQSEAPPSQSPIVFNVSNVFALRYSSTVSADSFVIIQYIPCENNRLMSKHRIGRMMCPPNVTA